MIYFDAQKNNKPNEMKNEYYSFGCERIILAMIENKCDSSRKSCGSFCFTIWIIFIFIRYAFTWWFDSGCCSSIQLFLFHFEYAGARRNKISTLVRVMLRGFSSFLSVFGFVSSALSHMTVAASSEFPWMFECVCVCAVYLIFWNIRSLNKLLIRLGEEDKKNDKNE